MSAEQIMEVERVYIDKHLRKGAKMMTFSGYFHMPPAQMEHAAMLHEYGSREEHDAWWWDFCEAQNWPKAKQ